MDLRPLQFNLKRFMCILNLWEYPDASASECKTTWWTSLLLLHMDQKLQASCSDLVPPLFCSHINALLRFEVWFKIYPHPKTYHWFKWTVPSTLSEPSCTWSEAYSRNWTQLQLSSFMLTNLGFLFNTALFNDTYKSTSLHDAIVKSPILQSYLIISQLIHAKSSAAYQSHIAEHNARKTIEYNKQSRNLSKPVRVRSSQSS